MKYTLSEKNQSIAPLQDTNDPTHQLLPIIFFRCLLVAVKIKNYVLVAVTPQKGYILIAVTQ